MPDSAMAVTTTAPDRVAPEPAAFATPIDRLSSLLQRADAAAGDARRAAASELNGLVAQLARSPSRPLADLLLRWLDQGALADLEDGDGQTTRAAAVGALLSMGYPYALEISPDDLDHLRQRSAAAGVSGGTLAAFLVVAVTSGFALLETASDGGGLGAHTGVVVAVLASMLGAAVTRPRSRGRRLALVSLLLTGLMTLSLALSNSTLFLPALGALMAFGMAWPRKGSGS